MPDVDRAELDRRARKTFEIVDTQQPSGLTETVHEDVQMLFLGIPFDGLAAVSEMLEGLYRALPVQEHVIENVVVDETTQQVALQTRLNGTHEGPFETVLGPIDGKGQQVSWQSGTFLKFKDGKVAQWEVYLDQVTVLGQLGVEPAAAFVS
jgi:predicted ester cyclase